VGLERKQFVDRKTQRDARRAIGPHDGFRARIVQQDALIERIEQEAEIGFGGKFHDRKRSAHEFKT
jgi:hypothetical protein